MISNYCVTYQPGVNNVPEIWIVPNIKVEKCNGEIKQTSWVQATVPGSNGYFTICIENFENYCLNLNSNKEVHLTKRDPNDLSQQWQHNATTGVLMNLKLKSTGDRYCADYERGQMVMNIFGCNLISPSKIIFE